MANEKDAQRPIINVWQARGILDLMNKFYSNPANVAAYEKWKSEKEEAIHA